MTDSYINVTNGGTSYVGPDATQLFRAGSIRMALRLWKKGIKVNRHARLGWLLKSAGGFTGKTYRNRDIDQAISDLTIWMDAMRAALPVVGE